MHQVPEPRRSRGLLGWGCAAALCAAHGYLIWLGMGGRAGLAGDWPIWRDDHPLYYHSALVTRDFLRASGTTAGYDPSFMAGYAKSVVFPSSSTLPELVVAAFGGARPERAYKLYVLIGAASVPWLFAGACALWRLGPEATACALLLFLAYIWSDLTMGYAAVGMVPYLLMVPLGLVATGALCRYLDRGGFGPWVFAACTMSAAALTHLTAALVVAPAAALAYGAAARRRGGNVPALPASRHLGVWLIPPLVLAVNAFWWLPGIALAGTKGPSDFAFVHPEGVLARLWQIAERGPPVEAVLIALGMPGLWALVRRDRARGLALAGFIAAGFGWGYLAAAVRVLDFLQPGRHTYAFYSGFALAAGLGVAEVLSRLSASGGAWLARWTAVGLVLAGTRVLGVPTATAVRTLLGARGGEPFLTSRPPARLRGLVERVQRHVRRGERLLYEESGFGSDDGHDPFGGGRFSGLFPERTGVELLGGPYLHASLTTNFTQFGEGKLFGKKNWDRAHFTRYARLYRPAAIVCWSPHARAFCRANPDLIQVLDDDGTLLFGRVKGFEGATIRGSAEIEAEPGRLRVRHAVGDKDGLVVLRYHFVPGMRAEPPVRLEPVHEADDPVPFIGLRPPPAETEITLRVLP